VQNAKGQKKGEHGPKTIKEKGVPTAGTLGGEFIQVTVGAK